jgi:hypothetical protein
MDTLMHIKRHTLTRDDLSLFVPVIPRGGMIMDIILYRPYGPGETVTVEIFNDDSNRVGVFTVETNKLHPINLAVEGIVPIQVSADIEELVLLYKA